MPSDAQTWPSFAGSLLSGLFPSRLRLGFSRLRLQWPLFASDRQDASILTYLTKDLAKVEAQIRRDGLRDHEYIRFLYYETFVRTVDAVSTLVSSTARAPASVAIKLLWRRVGGEPVIRTLLRDGPSQGREFSQPPNYYPYTDNTAFEQLISEKKLRGYFVSDNLSALATRELYKNSNRRWPYFYNATAVAAIPVNGVHRGHLLGFLAVDIRAGKLSSNRVRRALEAVSYHLYDILGMAYAAEAYIEYADHSFDLKTWEKYREEFKSVVGWRCAGGDLEEIDHRHQKFFQNVLERLEQAHQNAPLIEQAASGLLRETTLPASEEGVSPMTTDTWLNWDEEIADEDLDQERLRAFRSQLPTTRKHFVEAMEGIAEQNPYARAVVQAAREESK